MSTLPPLAPGGLVGGGLVCAIAAHGQQQCCNERPEDRHANDARTRSGIDHGRPPKNMHQTRLVDRSSRARRPHPMHHSAAYDASIGSRLDSTLGSTVHEVEQHGALSARNSVQIAIEDASTAARRRPMMLRPQV
jgi:hypothetical protein